MLTPKIATAVGKNSNGRQSISLRSVLYDVSNGGQRSIREEYEQVLQKTVVVIEKPTSNTGLLSAVDDNMFYEGVVAWRGAVRKTRRLSQFAEPPLPSTPEAWQGLDQFIVADDNISADMVAIDALRQWVERGGKLWLPLDRLSEETVLLLMGDAYQCQEVGRVDLSQVSFQSDEYGAVGSSAAPRTYEQPVSLVRVVTNRAEVVHTINGWPASFWVPLGKGEVLFTTLDIRGWIRPRTPEDPRPVHVLQGTDHVALPPLEFLGHRFFGRPLPMGLAGENFQAYLAPQVGYRIPSRAVVTGIFAAYCATLLGGGVFLFLRKRLQHFLWLTPVLSVVAAGVLASLGAGAKSTPVTVGNLQFLQVADGGNNGQISGAVLLYSPQRNDTILGAEKGGVFLPDVENIPSAKRMVWTDFNQWHWENLALPAGARRADYQIDAVFPDPLKAEVEFGPQGLTGEIRGADAITWSDAILATPVLGNVAVRWKGNRFTATADDSLATGQFLLDALVSDEQRRRQEVYRQLLQKSSSKRPYPATPMLLAWRTPFETHFNLPEHARQFGSALVAIPLTFRPTPPDRDVVIPWPLLPYRTVGRTRQEAGASTYNHRKDEWLAKQRLTTTILRFQIPESVLPLKISQADVTLKIRAPGREMEVLGGDPQQAVEIGRELNPVGAFRYRLTKPEQLYVDSTGGFFFEFTVSDILTPDESGEDTQNAWKVESLRLQVKGRTGKNP